MSRRHALLLSVLLILVLLPTADGLAPASGTPAAQTVTLTVDATEAPRKLFRAREVIPVSPGPLTLYYPKWIPGTHGSTGPIINLSGLTFTVSGKILTWRRDPVDMYAFHIDVPQGATAVEVSLGSWHRPSTAAPVRRPRTFRLLVELDAAAPAGRAHRRPRVVERALIDEAQGRLALGVLPHEYFHSWNGKYCRPTGLATPDFQTPMQGEMLWVYEGLTQYYGNVLAAQRALDADTV